MLSPRLLADASALLPRLQNLSRRHRRSIVGAAVALLAGFGITAVAVAPLMPDPAALPQRLVVQALQPEGLSSQLEALAEQDLSLTRSDITRGIDTAESLLARLGVQDAEFAQFLRSDATARLLLTGRGGKMVQARTDASGRLQELVARYPVEAADRARTHFTRLTANRVNGQWLAQLQIVPYGSSIRLGSGVIQSSLFGATDAVGLPDSVAMQMAEIFSVDIDFHRDLRRGDTFSVVYDILTADGEPVAWSEGVGRVRAAEFVNGGRTLQALWFDGEAGERGGYYGPNGESRRRMFLASPLAFSRVTSGFGVRVHPVLNQRRAHRGVDYGAPIGTEVRTVGDGVVEFSGWQNGYGKVIKVRHGQQHTTLYAHLSRADVTRGQRVQQGQRIGAVGMTGMTTGPHLHFEFLVNGEHRDPLQVARSAETVPLRAESLPRFQEMARAAQAKLSLAETVGGTRTRFE